MKTKLNIIRWREKEKGENTEEKKKEREIKEEFFFFKR